MILDWSLLNLLRLSLILGYGVVCRKFIVKTNPSIIRNASLTRVYLLMNEESGVKFISIIHLLLFVSWGACTPVLSVVNPWNLLNLRLIHSKTFRHLFRCYSLDSMVELLLQLGLANIQAYLLWVFVSHLRRFHRVHSFINNLRLRLLGCSNLGHTYFLVVSYYIFNSKVKIHSYSILTCWTEVPKCGSFGQYPWKIFEKQSNSSD